MSVETPLSWPEIHQLMNAEQACHGVFLGLAVFFTGLRLASKLIREKRYWGWDDGLIPVALACYVGYIICRIFQVDAEQGSRDPKNHVVKESAEYWHYQYISAHSSYTAQPLYLACIYFARLSVCFLFLRILAGEKSRLATKFIVGWLTLTFLPFFIVAWTPCFPVRRYFEPDFPGYCINYPPYFQAIRAVNLASDIFLLVVPIPTLWSIHAKTSFKIGLIFTFATASIGIASCLGSLIFFVRNPEATWDKYVIANTLTLVEMCMYIIAANLPPCRGLFSRLAKSNWTASYIASKSFFPLIGSKSGDSAPQRGLSVEENRRMGSDPQVIDYVKNSGDIESGPRVMARTTLTSYTEPREVKCPNCHTVSKPISP